MTKDKLIDMIANECGDITKASARKCLDATFNSITECLKKGDSVSIIGFGTFSITHRAARKGINPKTLQPIQIPARKAPKFSASSSLKKLCR